MRFESLLQLLGLGRLCHTGQGLQDLALRIVDILEGMEKQVIECLLPAGHGELLGWGRDSTKSNLTSASCRGGLHDRRRPSREPFRWHHADRRLDTRLQIRSTITAPTMAPISPAPSPARYQPTACPR